MRRFLSFWWRCVRLAARGNTPHANDWQWVVANPIWQAIGAAIGASLGGALKFFWPGAPELTPDTTAGVFLGGLAGFVITWILFFSARLANAPALLFYAEKQRADDAVKSADALTADGDSARDVGVSEAIAYNCYRQWGRSFFSAAASAEINGAGAYDEFLQAIADGRIPAWGKKQDHGVFEPIPKEFWFNNRIEWFGLLKDKPSTEPSVSSKGDVYSSLMTSRDAVEKYWPAIGSTGPRALSALRITLGMEDGYMDAAGSTLHQIRRTFNLKLENIGQKALSGCRVIVEATDPRSSIAFPIVLREGITLAPGEDIFIPLVRYGEARQPDTFNCADSFATLAAPDEKPLFNVGENALVSLKATGLDTPSYAVQCTIWVDEVGKLRLQREWPRRK
jgi:hypothetical protein